MKYLLTLISALLLFPLSSCSDGDDMPFRDELSGTVWSQKDRFSSDALYFDIEHRCTFIEQTSGMKDLKLECYYYYDAPNVTIEIFGRKYTGHIENGVLYIQLSGWDLALTRP